MATTTQIEETPKPRGAAFGFIFFASLMNSISFGILIPILPDLIKQMSGGDTAAASTWNALFATVWGLMQFVCGPILGMLSDRFGRRPVLLLSIFGLFVDFLFMALAPNLAWLFVGRVLNGITASSFSTANAYVADITPPEQRARRFGMLGAMFGVGFILGPVIGGLLGSINLRLPFYAAGGLALVNLTYGYFVLPESLPASRKHPVDWKTANPLSSLRRLAQLKGAAPLAVVVSCCGLAQFVLYTCWVLYTTFKFGWGPRDNGWSLAAVGVVSAISQGVLLGRLLKLVSVRRLAVMGLISSTIAYALWGAATQSWMMYAIIFVNVLGSTTSSSIQSIISSAAEAQDQGKTLGAVGGLNSLMAVIAPAIGAPLLTMVSHLPKGDWRIGTPFYFCATLQAVALLLTVLHFRNQRRARLAVHAAA